MTAENPVHAIVDAHVHIHDCYEPDALFAHAFRNLCASAILRANAERALFLMLTECASDNYFGALRALARGQSPDPPVRLAAWTPATTAEDSSLKVHGPAGELFLIAGSQIACREGLEVLLIGTTRRLPDGLSIREVLAQSASFGVPRVIPWGPGKWFGRRGRLLEELLVEFKGPTLFLGDEGGRPTFWGYPTHFRTGASVGVRDLPGTDPLPFPHDVDKVGRVGFTLPITLDRERPAASLLTALTHPDTQLQRFATLERPLRFVRNQIGMQLRKRRRA